MGGALLKILESSLGGGPCLGGGGLGPLLCSFLGCLESWGGEGLGSFGPQLHWRRGADPTGAGGLRGVPQLRCFWGCFSFETFWGAVPPKTLYVQVGSVPKFMFFSFLFELSEIPKGTTHRGGTANEEFTKKRNTQTKN